MWLGLAAENPTPYWAATLNFMGYDLMEVVMITQERLKEVLSYDPDTGVFTKKQKIGRGKAGSVAGSLNWKGYWLVSVDSKRYRAHRLAWLYMYGEMPDGQIDHINHDKTDNRIENLRVVTNAENHKNVKKHSNNSSGVSGVHWLKAREKWQVFIGSRPRKSLGYYYDYFEAVCARKSAEIKLGYHENHGR